ncbi:MAG: S-methyl-5-thioribose-1-phosphate isomerase [Rhodospirillales bacterium]|nr:S-methyl-5-thioribose-1-phosphate isomerase [Rhodospirillales bacterium]
MKVRGKPYRTIWPAADGWAVEIIDQTRLPFEFATLRLETLADAADAIKTMRVRGAPLIGATAAYGMALAMHADPSDGNLSAAAKALKVTRPTAVNLRWAVDDVTAHLKGLSPNARAGTAYERAGEICDDDVAICSAIGDHGLKLIEAAWQKKKKRGRVNVLTHCNAGWLATVDWGTALAPVYKAFDAGIPVHVWVDETRPRNQGAALTAWELIEHGVLCITGTDRTTASGDVANKIGTYLKALAARDNKVPFYVALPGPSIDWSLTDGRDIPIEERGAEEVTRMTGRTRAGEVVAVEVTPEGAAARNPGFDVTPARLISGLITERGVCKASKAGLAKLFPEKT